MWLFACATARTPWAGGERSGRQPPVRRRLGRWEPAPRWRCQSCGIMGTLKAQIEIVLGPLERRADGPRSVFEWEKRNGKCRRQLEDGDQPAGGRPGRSAGGG